MKRESLIPSPVVALLVGAAAWSLGFQTRVTARVGGIIPEGAGEERAAATPAQAAVDPCLAEVAPDRVSPSQLPVLLAVTLPTDIGEVRSVGSEIESGLVVETFSQTAVDGLELDLRLDASDAAVGTWRLVFESAQAECTGRLTIDASALDR